MDRVGERDVGGALIGLGWDQGMLLPAVGHAFYSLDADGVWQLESSSNSVSNEQMIVVTQSCDIVAISEPFIEAMPCYWERKGSNKYNGARVGNSARYFLLREQQSDQGQHGAIVVDATRRVQVAKTSLLDLLPTPPVGEDQRTDFSRRFRRWLGGRYSRPALDQPVVNAVQKPVVEAVSQLRPGDEEYEAIELVREVRMLPVEGDPPYGVHLIVLLDYEISSEDERVVGFRGLLEEAINGWPGESRLESCQAFTAEEMSVSEYENSIKLPLDHYSLAGESIQGTVPVEGIDYG